ncbi:amino acid ABC transporter membrane protein, PAAT family [Nakamurella panacisegetis]|uniref:Amino acid ABC transporter membrane protein, PAAT family n=1 Tax=Nakamurella panacisegetis TaxID=1090615 RepID=A0A1H0NJ31_9ACTN|nr:amino acid ABC transporter permease [Nakamurella panacisegetis]SDO92693.1 amino acid ABC transporter membrane protein, PAAT family [Nakamurella panacisegetis]
MSTTPLEKNVTSAPPTLATSAARPKTALQRVIPLRHPGRWIAIAVVVVIFAQFGHGLITNPFYQWSRFRYWFLRPVILDGLVVTLQVAAYSAVLGLIGGIILAVGRSSRNPLLSGLSWLYIWVFRSIPLIVVLIFVYNFSALYPRLSFGVPFGPAFFSVDESKLFSYMAIAVIGLSLNEAAYAAEVVRSGLLSVDQGQLEAATALGMSKGRTFRRVQLPQALRTIVPSYVNQLIGLIKGTSIVFYVSLLDLFGQVETMGSTYPEDIIPLLMVATVWYLVLTTVLSVVQYYVERAYSKGALRTMPLTPLQKARKSVTDLRARFRDSSDASRFGVTQ